MPVSPALRGVRKENHKPGLHSEFPGQLELHCKTLSQKQTNTKNILFLTELFGHSLNGTSTDGRFMPFKVYYTNAELESFKNPANSFLGSHNIKICK
jgi:hypothetical protein